MGEKSRGNFPVVECVKFDCANRAPGYCVECLRFSHYEKQPFLLPGGDDLLCVKELADRLGRHTSYIYAMRRDGFEMPGGLSTVNRAMEWLAAHRNWRQKGTTHAQTQ